MENNRFVVKLEDVKEFLKTKLGLDWDGYTIDLTWNGEEPLFTVKNKNVPVFANEKGYPTKLFEFIKADNKKGKTRFYSLEVDGLYTFRLLDCENTKYTEDEGFFNDEWENFLIKKYGKKVADEIINHHTLQMNADLSIINDLSKQVSIYENHAKFEQQRLKEIDFLMNKKNDMTL